MQKNEVAEGRTNRMVKKGLECDVSGGNTLLIQASCNMVFSSFGVASGGRKS